MQQISAKSRDALYDVVHTEIMDARIKINKLKIGDKFITEQIDKILYDLTISAPQKAISCFEYPKER